MEKQKKEIEQRFNETKTKLDEVNLQARQLAEELLRIQGEYRLIIKLENENNKPKTESISENAVK